MMLTERGVGFKTNVAQHFDMDATPIIRHYLKGIPA